MQIARRDAARLRTVLAVVVQHGFADTLYRIPFAARLLGAPKKPDSQMEGTAAERFARMLAALGPTYIKLGQVLSMRADLLPADYVDALVTLQDRAPEISIVTVRAEIERGLGRPTEALFAHFDETPLATASIAQTHVATTKGGRRVVVKVQRPGIGDTMRGDLDLLFIAAQALESSIDEIKLAQPTGIIAEFENSLMRELSFSAELSNLVRARSLLDPERPVVVPEPIPELSCRTVLTMELFDGKPIRKLEPKSEMACQAVEALLHVMVKGILIDGFFHGDPHAGNILVGEDGTTCLIDWGLTGTLSPEQRDDLVTLVLGTIVDDASTVARVLLKMGTPTQRVNIAELKRDITRIRGEYVMVRSLEQLDTTGFIDEFTRATNKYRVKLATEYTVLMKALGTLEGLVRQLHPELDLIALVRPYAERALGERWSPEKLLLQAVGGTTGMVSLVRTMPTRVDQILHDVESGNVQIRPIVPKLDLLPDRIHDGASRIAAAMFAASMSVCAMLALPDGQQGWVRPVFFVLSLLFAVSGWWLTFWWHWLGRGLSLRVTPWLRFFRRSDRGIG